MCSAGCFRCQIQTTRYVVDNSSSNIRTVTSNHLQHCVSLVPSSAACKQSTSSVTFFERYLFLLPSSSTGFLAPSAPACERSPIPVFCTYGFLVPRSPAPGWCLTSISTTIGFSDHDPPHVHGRQQLSSSIRTSWTILPCMQQVTNNHLP